MPLKNYLIGPQKEGQQDNVESFYLPEDAYESLEDMYVWRGRLRKRFGYSLIGDSDLDSRLRINVGTTDGSGDIEAALPGTAFEVGQSFSIGSEVYTVNQLGTSFSITNITQANPGEVTTSSPHGLSTNDVVYIDQVLGMTEVNQMFFTITVTGVTTFTLGVDTLAFGAYTMEGIVNKGVTTLSTGGGTGLIASNNGGIGGIKITGSTPTTDLYFYPSQPVMGLRTRERTNINREETIAFDTQFSYYQVAGAWERLGTFESTPNDTAFLWTSNYRSSTADFTYMFTTNGLTASGGLNGIWYLDNGSPGTWTQFIPFLDTGMTRTLLGCLIILPFKDRLVALSTIEGGTGSGTFRNRCRFSQNGTPIDINNSWKDNISGFGGYVDAPTNEAIVSAEYLKDQLIVYFERSTYELVYTGYKSLPFVWQHINNELGCESTFSTIGFDKSVIGVGNVGIHSCNGVNVKRIDEKIPVQVFSIHNGEDGPARVYGIRDYYNELVYWTFPDTQEDQKYPNRILLYNHVNNTWAIFNDSFTCFGYFQPTSDVIWADLGSKFGTWERWGTPWGSPLYQSSQLNILSGNQQGFVFKLDNSNYGNSQSLLITDMDTNNQQLTIVNHNLKIGDYVFIKDADGITLFQDDEINDITTFKVVKIDENTIAVDQTSNPLFGWEGTYTGKGKIGRISNITARTKEFNPGTQVAKGFRMPYIDFLVNQTENGEVSIDYFLDTSSNKSVQESEKATSVLLGESFLSTQSETSLGDQSNQSQIWKRYYVQAQASFIQLLIFMNNDQMRDLSVAQSDFEIHGIIFYAEETGRIVG